MPIGAPGAEQFRRAITTKLRNLHIVAGLYPLILMRQELIGNDQLNDRGGLDTPSQHHFIALLRYADGWRRRVTHNPDDANLGDKILKDISVSEEIDLGSNPFGGDEVQGQSGGLFDLPFALDGSDPDIPLGSRLVIKSGNAILMLGAIDRAIVTWTRLNSRHRTRFITRMDSMRVFGHYQEIGEYLASFAGDEKRVDVAQVLPSEEPLGPDDSPNFKSESSNRTPSG